MHMGEQRPENTVTPEGEPEVEDAPSEGVSSRRSFLSKNLRRAVYIAPIVWSVSARTALAVTGLTPGPSPPE
jgi:hypothetical protein